MANKTHFSMLRRSIPEWNQWRDKNPEARANISGADLSRAYLSKANLRKTDLSRANLSEANLSEANLSEATLSGADLSGATLRGTDLRETDLSEATLSGADLREAYLSKANLRKTDLSRADLSGATLSGADLSGADLRETDLSGADLSEADGLPEAPRIEHLSARILATIETTPASFDMGIWHNSCGTVHCWAGHIVLAGGDEAAALEKSYDTPLAAMLICARSEQRLPIPNFYESNDKARDALRARAAGGASIPEDHCEYCDASLDSHGSVCLALDKGLVADCCPLRPLPPCGYSIDRIDDQTYGCSAK